MGAPPEEIRPVEVIPIGRGYALVRADSRRRNSAKPVDGCGNCGGLVPSAAFRAMCSGSRARGAKNQR